MENERPRPTDIPAHHRRKKSSEPWIWITAAGLATGVLMASALFLLILVKGAASFWPGRIDLMETVAADGSISTIAGIVTRHGERRDNDGTVHQEIQIFRGNKDLDPNTFQNLDRSSIRNMSRPTSLLWIERSEFGPAIAHGVAVETKDGRIEASSPVFLDTLNTMIRKSADSRDRLLLIERWEIGEVSRELEKLSRLERNGGNPAATSPRRAELQQKFEELQNRAAAIRSELAESKFIGRTADEKELIVPAENLLGVFESNRAGFFGRTGEALHRVWKFLSEEPREANTEGGVFPAIFGTVMMTLVMSLFVTPFGVIAAIYLREYAGDGLLVRIVRICVNNLAGVPSIVFGVFGLAFFVYFVGAKVDETFFADKLPTPTFGTPGILWASLTLALLTLPVVIVASEEALSAVPRGVREAALACGASKWQTIRRVVLPASLPGILTGVILAMARGAGEVAPLMLVGAVKLAPSLPIDAVAPFIHAERKFMHLGFHVYDLGFQSPDAEAAKPMVYATALLLVVVVVTLNLAAIIVRNRIRKRFASTSF